MFQAWFGNIALYAMNSRLRIKVSYSKPNKSLGQFQPYFVAGSIYRCTALYIYMNAKRYSQDMVCIQFYVCEGVCLCAGAS